MGRRREALRRDTGVGAYEKAVSNALEIVTRVQRLTSLTWDGEQIDFQLP